MLYFGLTVGAAPAAFATADWGVVALYFVAVFAVALWAARSEATTGSSAGFFLAGRNTGWFVVGASIFASNIGSEHLIGLAGAGASSGLPVAQYEILAAFALLLLGWLFVPFYLKTGVFTMPEFLEKRYSGGTRTYLTIVSLIGYILTKVSVTLAAGGIVFETLMGIDFWTGALITVVVTGLYTVIGGLKAVLYTDALQMVILLIGAIILLFLGLQAVGGWSEMVAAVPEETMSVWRASDHSDYPWTGILLGAPILAVWYWCTDQYIVQRVLAAGGIPEARRSTIFAGLLKQLPLFIFVVPGILAFVLSERGAFDLGASDQALPALVQYLLPAGLKGLFAAALLAALMSSLSSVFNCCSTLITMDIIKRYNPDVPEKSLVRYGQGATVVMVILGLAWIPFMDLVSGELFQYIQNVQAYIAPPIAAIFLLGVAHKGVTVKGAGYALALGAVLGLVRLSLEIMGVGAGLFTNSNFLHFAFAMFLVCVATALLVSRFDSIPARPLEAVADAGDAATGRSLDLMLTGVLLVIVVLIWTIFA